MQRKLLVVLATSLALLINSGVAYGQSLFEGVELSIIPVAGNVYIVQRPGGGGNIGAQIGSDGVLLVDSLFATLTSRLVEAIGSVTDEEIRFLINTHIHVDHVGGNASLAEMGVLIFSHEYTRLRFFDDQARVPRNGGRLYAVPTGCGETSYHIR